MTRGLSVLHYIAALGNTKALLRILERAPSTTEKMTSPIHPIHLAAYSGHLEFVRVLLRHSKDPHILVDIRTREEKVVPPNELEARNVYLGRNSWQLGEDITGGCPLHFAAANGHLDVVEFLVRDGANLEVRDEYGLTAIQYAVEEPVSTDVFQLLAVAGSNVNTRDYMGRTPFMRAAGAGSVNTLKVMLEYNVEIAAHNLNGETALHLAVDTGEIEAAELLVTLGLDPLDPDCKGRSAIQTAIYEEHYSFALRHLPEVDPLRSNIEGSILNTATTCAAGSDNNALVEKLLERVPIDKANEYVNFSSAAGTPLYCSAVRGNIPVMQSLLHRGAQINLVGGPLGTPLLAACKIGRLEVVSFLLKKRAIIDDINNDGTISSAIEAARDHDDILMLLDRFKSTGIERLAEPLARRKANISKVDEILAVFEARKTAAEEEAEKGGEIEDAFCPP